MFLDFFIDAHLFVIKLFQLVLLMLAATIKRSLLFLYIQSP